MKLRVLILFLLIHLMDDVVLAQPNATIVRPSNKDGEKEGSGPIKKKPTVLITFITDDPCNLVVNGNKKSIGAGKSAVVGLPMGKYRIEATNPLTGDLFIDTIQVESKAPRTINIPLKEVRIKRESSGKKEPKLEDAIKENGGEALGVVRQIFDNLVKIEGGRFTMGDNNGPADARPEHSVQLKAFYMSKYEVTQFQWESLTGNNPSVHAGCAECPVENITPDEANLFLNKVNAVSSRKVRLPTEAEWEYVAKAGGAITDPNASAWYAHNAAKQTQPVGKLQPNGLGIYDLFGNVAELCKDWYDAAYYKNSEPENPTGPMDGRERVVRGGSYASNIDAFHPSIRGKQSWFGKSGALGMRIVLD